MHEHGSKIIVLHRFWFFIQSSPGIGIHLKLPIAKARGFLGTIASLALERYKH